MSDKYVAYLDILGFKNWLNNNDMYEANNYMLSYSQAFHEVWEQEDVKGLFCYMVSDCAVLHTDDLDKHKLEKMLNISIRIAKNLFEKTGILIRGAVCKGDFENISQNEHTENLVENIFTGNAYVDAFLLEEKPKVAGIAIAKDVENDIAQHLEDIEIVKLKEFSIIRYFTYDFLIKKGNLNKFIELAVKAEWLPHYHNTLYTVLYKSHPEYKRLFDVVINDLESKDSKGNFTRKFISSAFDKEVDDNYIKQFASYIRSKIFDRKENSDL